MRNIIMLSGWCGSGKDLAADYLVKNKRFTKMSIATELKKLVSDTYKFDYNLTMTQEGKRTLIDIGYNGNTTVKKTVRNLLIDEALYRKKQMNEDLFISHLIGKIDCFDLESKLADQHLKDIVIPDFRFLNEYSYMNSHFDTQLANILNNNNKTRIITVRINRFKAPLIQCDSESQLDNFKFDYVISNKTSISSFYSKIENILVTL